MKSSIPNGEALILLTENLLTKCSAFFVSCWQLNKYSADFWKKLLESQEHAGDIFTVVSTEDHGNKYLEIKDIKIPENYLYKIKRYYTNSLKCVKYKNNKIISIKNKKKV